MARRDQLKAAIDLEVQKEGWPLLKIERNWNSTALTWACLTVGIATWSYPIGGSVSYYLNASLGTAAMIAGGLIGIFLVVMATIPPTTRYGIDSNVASVPFFGTKGCVIAILLQYFSIIGWNCLLLILFGRAAASILIAANLISRDQEGLVATVLTLGAIIVTWYIIRGGAAALRKYAVFIALFVLVISGILLYLLLTKVGISNIFTSKPSAPSSDNLWNYVAGVEILIASVLSYWPYTGSVVRMVPKANKAIWPVMLAMGLPIGIISLIGLYAALATGNPDPGYWIVDIGGVEIGILVLIGLGVANIGTAVTGDYATGIGLRQLSIVNKKMNWNQTAIVVLAPVAIISVFFPILFVEKVPTFLAFLGVFFAPVVGIQITDNLILRKNNLHVSSLYDKSPNSIYYFWGGINIAAIIGLIVGVMTYLSILNPITYISNDWFKFTSASLPSLVLAGVSYYLVTKLVNIPFKIGGYY